MAALGSMWSWWRGVLGLGLLGIVLPAAGEQADKPAGPEWVVPSEERARANPVPASAEAMRKGRFLYQRHCGMCHGEKGKADGPAARLHAQRSHRQVKDLTEPAVQAGMTDGEIFSKITTGFREGDRIIMPTFVREIPAEEDRWKLVHFVRSFGKPQG